VQFFSVGLVFCPPAIKLRACGRRDQTGSSERETKTVTDWLDLDRAIRAITDPMVVMRRIVDQVLALTPGAEGAVVELASEGYLVYACAAGSLAKHVGARLRLDGSLSGLAVRDGETLVCEDSVTDARVDHEACVLVGAVSMICVPLYRGGQPVGVLKVSASRPRAFGDEAVGPLRRLAGFISAAIGAASEIASITAEVLSYREHLDHPAAAEPSDPVLPDRGVLDTDAVNEFVANVLQPGIVADAQTRRRIERVLAGAEFTIVCQPIIDLDSGQLMGAEAMTRFRGPPEQTPDVWFDQANRLGLGVELELAAVKRALMLINRIPGDAFLAINIGPEAIGVGELPLLLESAGAHRIVLELTEHVRVADYPRLQNALVDIRARGTRLAIDDTGAGFASLAHILKLGPDIIKLDRDITRGIDCDPVRRALARALVSFAADMGAEVIAEGIETAAELDTARELGIHSGQGYLLGRPAPLAALLQAHADTSRANRPSSGPRHHAKVARREMAP
jgi:EAL domain-containing protein (putative c-di-GMP-specific phosphodiesterase class I)